MTSALVTAAVTLFATVIWLTWPDKPACEREMAALDQQRSGDRYG